jgi:hypothetical protein
LFFSGARHVAYAAHIGGLMSGAAFAFIRLRLFSTLKFARAYRQKGMTAKRNQCLQLICRKYPDSIEARVAR